MSHEQGMKAELFEMQHIKQLYRSTLLRQVSTVMLGYIIAQLLLIAATPILTRLYSPAAFAGLGYVMAFSSIVLPLLSLRLEYALPLTQTDEQASGLMLVSSLFVVGFCLLLSIVLYLNRATLQVHLSLTQSTLYCLFIIFLLQGFCQILRLQCINKNRVRYVAQCKVAQNLTIIISQLALAALLSTNETLLIAGYTLGLLASFVLLCRFIIKNTVLSLPTFSLMAQLFKRYYKFPLHSSWTTMLDSMATWIPVFFIGVVFGEVNAGLYFVVTRTFQLPIGLLGTALSQVLLKRFSDSYLAKQSLLPLVKKTFLLLACISLLYLVMLYLLAPYLDILFGKKWQHGGYILMILAPAIVVSFCVSPLTNIFGVCNRNELCSIWQIIYLALTMIALVTGYATHNFSIFLVSLSIAWVISYAIYARLIFMVATQTVMLGEQVLG